MYKIISFNKEYRDDLIFCYLLSKEALGVVPHIREDLFDIPKNYFNNNDKFWIAVNDDNRVIGMLGSNTISVTDLWLRRFFIRPDAKRNGIGSALLAKLEEYAKEKGIKTIHTRFGYNYIEATMFYPSKGFHEVEPSEGLRHFIKEIP